jgi:sulfide dehydrogenase cytochrome subunit
MNDYPLTKLALVLAMMTTGASHAVEQQTLYTQSLAATCANCHGTAGKGIPNGSIPKLAGLKNDYFIEQMQAFKSGTRPATIMHQLSKGYSDEQIRLMASYFASQQP